MQIDLTISAWQLCHITTLFQKDTTMDNSNNALTEQLAHAAKISELLGEFEDLARAKGLDLGEVIEQYNEENLPDGTEDGEYHYFRGIDMCNLP